MCKRLEIFFLRKRLLSIQMRIRCVGAEGWKAHLAWMPHKLLEEDVQRRSRQLLVRRGINWDKLEVQLHGFVAAARRSWDGGWKGRSERACNATLIAATKKLNRRLQKLLFVQ
ncbi:hypothetical protein CY35_12G105800 [Sphagnum magellanicum]|nr:hypothetical protein CY35_12G105800 [Sphagnum magellanicum]